MQSNSTRQHPPPQINELSSPGASNHGQHALNVPDAYIAQQHGSNTNAHQPGYLHSPREPQSKTHDFSTAPYSNTNTTSHSILDATVLSSPNDALQTGHDTFSAFVLGSNGLNSPTSGPVAGFVSPTSATAAVARSSVATSGFGAPPLTALSSALSFGPTGFLPLALTGSAAAHVNVNPSTLAANTPAAGSSGFTVRATAAGVRAHGAQDEYPSPFSHHGLTSPREITASLGLTSQFSATMGTRGAGLRSPAASGLALPAGINVSTPLNGLSGSGRPITRPMIPLIAGSRSNNASSSQAFGPGFGTVLQTTANVGLALNLFSDATHRSPVANQNNANTSAAHATVPVGTSSAWHNVTTQSKRPGNHQADCNESDTNDTADDESSDSASDNRVRCIGTHSHMYHDRARARRASDCSSNSSSSSHSSRSSSVVCRGRNGDTVGGLTGGHVALSGTVAADATGALGASGVKGSWSHESPSQRTSQTGAAVTKSTVNSDDDSDDSCSTGDNDDKYDDDVSLSDANAGNDSHTFMATAATAITSQGCLLQRPQPSGHPYAGLRGANVTSNAATNVAVEDVMRAAHAASATGGGRAVHNVVANHPMIDNDDASAEQYSQPPPLAEKQQYHQQQQQRHPQLRTSARHRLITEQRAQAANTTAQAAASARSAVMPSNTSRSSGGMPAARAAIVSTDYGNNSFAAAYTMTSALPQLLSSAGATASATGGANDHGERSAVVTSPFTGPDGAALSSDDAAILQLLPSQRLPVPNTRYYVCSRTLDVCEPQADGSSRVITSLTASELSAVKKVQRLARNRASAHLSRARRKNYVSFLEQQLRESIEKAERLESEVLALRSAAAATAAAQAQGQTLVHAAAGQFGHDNAVAAQGANAGPGVSIRRLCSTNGAIRGPRGLPGYNQTQRHSYVDNNNDTGGSEYAMVHASANQAPVVHDHYTAAHHSSSTYNRASTAGVYGFYHGNNGDDHGDDNDTDDAAAAHYAQSHTHAPQSQFQSSAFVPTYNTNTSVSSYPHSHGAYIYNDTTSGAIAKSVTVNGAAAAAADAITTHGGENCALSGYMSHAAPQG